MAVRKIVKIDESKCDGCGQCIVGCAEGALKIVDGKARLVKDSYCDGLGACLGACPVDAITIEEREADEFDEVAVEKHLAESKEAPAPLPLAPGGCPGAAMRRMQRPSPAAAGSEGGTSQLSHWPVQLALVPPHAPFLQDADLLLVADCVPFAMADFHARFLRGRPVVIGCPKLDDPQSYVDKLAEIFRQASVRSLTILHMEVPCCTGLCGIAKAALDVSGVPVPVSEVTVSVNGDVLGNDE